MGWADPPCPPQSSLLRLGFFHSLLPHPSRPVPGLTPAYPGPRNTDSLQPSERACACAQRDADPSLTQETSKGSRKQWAQLTPSRQKCSVTAHSLGIFHPTRISAGHP